jgi:argininosuccinate synthase
MTQRKVVLAFSGGLDTSYSLVALREQGWQVLTVTVNTGGLHDGDADAIRTRAEKLGSARHVVVDAREELYRRVISYAIKANYLRNGGYPSCVGAERQVQAEKVVDVARSVGADAVAHGSTGAGADHVRYDAVIKALAPRLEIVALVRDGALTREWERDFLRERGFEASDKVTRYSVNEGLLGTTIGGGETHGSWEYLPEDVWAVTRSVDDAPDEPAELIIGFERGEVVSCTDLAGTPVPGTGPGAPDHAVLGALNTIGATHGVGRGIHMGSTMMGNLARVGFEAPGMLILIAAHRELERLVLTNRQQATKAPLGTTLGDLLHEGIYYDPVLDDIRAFLDRSQVRVTGEVRVRLFKGGIVPLGSRSPYSLLDASARRGVVYGYGSSLWTSQEARAFAHMYAIPGAIVRTAGPDTTPER